MSRIVIQMGHVPRTAGATGTYREQEFVKVVGPRLRTALIDRGHVVSLIGADDPVPNSDVFIALHTDGNATSLVRGASVGYPSDDLSSPHAVLASAFKRWHQRNGYLGGFHKDNYTTNLRKYYGFGRSNARFKFLAEHGTTTNQEDETWLFSNIDRCVMAHVDAIGEVIGHPIQDIPRPTFGGSIVNGISRQQGGFSLVGPDGGVFCYDGAPFLGSLPSINVKPSAPIVSMAWTLSGNGYWLLGEDGGIFPFGDAKLRGTYLDLPANVRNDPNRKFAVLIANSDGGYTEFSRSREPYRF